ncbi:CYTH domain-containing protein [Methylotenera sp. L2L1]|uniref:CYTH domain-containing protein n=1 Tax=Methylotenera sp. L2L1 TaxID=1502770 RepID=UPI000565AA64|nr:CYTH domain-containing protein [Methylotenera sp. L2L1]
MALEIERKFLVIGNEWQLAAGVKFSQGYLNRDKNRTVRVRVAGEQGFLTIKGATHGATRTEFEYEIPLADAESLLDLCERPIIQKIRRICDYKGFKWEVDEFQGENSGLVVAEIELQSETQSFEKPSWIGKEVTDDPRYYNSNLAQHPYTTWVK